MIRDALTALCQEPWCFHPDQIARLTDWQIAELYLKPAVERSRRMEEESARARAGFPGGPPPSRNGTPPGSPRRKPGEKPQKGDPDYRGPQHEPGTPEFREEMIWAFTTVGGMSPERAAKEFERQMALWRAMEGK